MSLAVEVLPEPRVIRDRMYVIPVYLLLLQDSLKSWWGFREAPRDLFPGCSPPLPV